MIGLDGKVHVIRRGENLDYVQELEEMPEHLAQSTPKKTNGTHPGHSRRNGVPHLNGNKGGHRP